LAQEACCQEVGEIREPQKSNGKSRSNVISPHRGDRGIRVWWIQEREMNMSVRSGNHERAMDSQGAMLSARTGVIEAFVFGGSRKER